MIIDTLHPVYEGRLFRWGHDPSQPGVVEYGRTVVPEGAGARGRARKGPPQAGGRSPFFHLLQTGENLLRRRVTEESAAEFPVVKDYLAAGSTDYVAIVSRFAPEGVIGEMDCVYSSWIDHACGRLLRRADRRR